MVFSLLTRSVTKLSGRVPLRVIFVVPFVLQVFGAVGVVGYLSFRNGQKAVNDVATQLRREVITRIQENLETYIQAPLLLNQIHANGIELGQIDLQDARRLQRHLWKSIQSFDSIRGTYAGNTQGEFFGATALSNGIQQVTLADESTDGNLNIYMADSEGNPTTLIESVPNYDPRVRPWYKAAVEAGVQPLWTEIYTDFATKESAITATQAVYDKSGQLLGVVGSDFFFTRINEFLHDLKIGQSGQTFIIERDGMLVSTSTLDPVFFIEGEQTKRIKASESENIIIRATANYLLDNFGNFSQIKTTKNLDFYLKGERQFLQVAPLKDGKGLDWLIVVVVPESDFMAQIDANTRTTIVLCLLALVVATSAGILTSRWVVQPILQLKEAAMALSEGQFERTVNLERSDELGILARAFNTMALQLQESFNTLESQNIQLQRLDQLKDEFLANTSHELRTPLNGIIGLTESLIDGATGQLPPQTVANLTTISACGRRLSNLVNDILDFSQLKYKTIELQIKPIELRSLVEVVFVLSQPLIGNKPLELINSIPPDIPLVDADENRLLQIFHNLIGNAIKFTESGTVEASAIVLKDRESETNSREFIAITISDTGIGIPEDKLEQIFEFFEQADGSTAREYGGTGLGLAITKQLIALHGGEIRVESKIGEGSKFRLTLPISRELVKSNSEFSPIQNISTNLELFNEISIDSATLTVNTGDFKILIVDDEAINLQVLTNNLSLQNYAITQASNGLEALDILERGFKPDLILLDVMMPRMTGYEVCQKIREKFLPSELPIVMLTAKNQTSDLVEGFISGANDYLAKPFSKNELLARIKTHIHLAKINAAYGRFVPHDFLRFLGRESIIEVKLGDHVEKDMTILFSDIRSFTRLSEEMTPEDNFNFINSYLLRVSPVIRAHNGFIDKYIGDAIMALFPESADDAVRGAIAMQQQVTLYNQDRQQQRDIPIAIGIGLHTGNLMLGTIGEQERMESTVISDAVNLASRLEGLTKLYGAGILISGQTLFKLEEFQNYNFRFLNRVRVKGKKKAIAVFEVFDGDSESIKQLKIKTKTSFERGAFLFHQHKLSRSQEIFTEVLQENPDDKAARFYVQQCENPQKYGELNRWDAEDYL